MVRWLRLEMGLAHNHDLRGDVVQLSSWIHDDSRLTVSRDWSLTDANTGAVFGKCTRCVWYDCVFCAASTSTQHLGGRQHGDEAAEQTATVDAGHNPAV